MFHSATGDHAKCSILIDVDIVEFDDIKADDLGSWKATGNKKTFFRVT